MGTLMEDLQTRIESAVNKTGTYNEALQRLANLFGVSPSETGSRLIPVARDFDASIDNATAAQNYLLLNPTQLPTMGLNFVDEPTLDSRITFTRASGATFFNSAGVLTTAGNNVARFDYDPSTLAARGLLIEEQRVNSIRNNTMQGAVAGTPGTLPTNWIFSAGGTSTQVVGTGTENGVSYIDLRIFGTTTADGGLQYEANTQIAAVSGQTWSLSHFVKVLAGSVSFIRHRIIERAAAGTYLQEGNSLFTPASSVSLLAASRFSYAYTTANASTAFVVPGLLFNWGVGTSVDFTLRIGLPQLEQGAFATSVIPTTGSTATRNADSASITGANFSSWYNATEGTLFADVISANGSGARALTVSDGTINNQIWLRESSAGTAAFEVYTAGAFVAQIGVLGSQPIKSAGAYKTNDFAISLNGGAVATDTSGALGTYSQMNIGANFNASGAFLNGHIRRIAFYPRRLSNTELVSITS